MKRRTDDTTYVYSDQKLTSTVSLAVTEYEPAVSPSQPGLADTLTFQSGGPPGGR